MTRIVGYVFDTPAEAPKPAEKKETKSGAKKAAPKRRRSATKKD